jgi:hypothetical protein
MGLRVSVRGDGAGRKCGAAVRGRLSMRGRAQRANRVDGSERRSGSVQYQSEERVLAEGKVSLVEGRASERARERERERERESEKGKERESKRCVFERGRGEDGRAVERARASSSSGWKLRSL